MSTEPHNPEFATGTEVRALLEALAGAERKLFEGPNAPADDQQVLEGYRWMFSMLQVALDTQVWSDSRRPRFVDIVGPYKKWGGDNSDAYYQYAPIDPTRTYRVRAVAGDAAYLISNCCVMPNFSTRLRSVARVMPSSFAA